MPGRRMLGIALLAALAATGARADEAALRKRIEELEEQQRQFTEQLRELRQQLERQQAPAAAAPAPAPVVAPVPAPAVPASVPSPAPAVAAPAPLSPAVPGEAQPDRVEEVERKTGILTEEIRKIREFLVLPETQELKGYYGLGPAASKVYGVQRGLSIGGYGETNFNKVVENGNGTSDNFDFVRLVAYLGYKFNDWIVFNSEIEFEHATTASTVSAGSGSVSVEMANLDFLLHPAANARAGLVLVPIGFINEVHEPPFYLGNVRPPVETQVIPTTWRANGVGLFGQLLPGLEYKAYGITSLDAEGYRTLNLRTARQNGNRELASDWSFVGRVDYAPLADWSFGGSMLLGDQGQNQNYGNEDIGFSKVGVFTQIYEIHTQVQTQGLWFRALGTTVLVDDAGVLSRDDAIQESQCGAMAEPPFTDCPPIGKVLLGAYAEVAYDIMPFFLPETAQYLAPWFRYSWLDTNNRVAKGFHRDQAARRDFYEFGLQYKPIPQVVLKADYHIQDAEEGTLPYELRLGGGFVF